MPYLKYNPHVVALDQRQPERVQTFREYLAATITSDRVQRAREAFRTHRAALHHAEQTYGVSANVIVALWAMESDLGQHQGNFNTLSALATLAYDGRRRTFFESELTAALQMVGRGVAPESLMGSWAGAMGQCQFMPSTYLRYAVGSKPNARADIWKSPQDTFNSIANYLKNIGWQTEKSIAEQSSQEFSPDNQHKVLANAIPLGQHKDDIGAVMPVSHVDTQVVQPDGPGSQAYQTYDNFGVLMHWNRSTYFVLAIADLAGRINP